MKKLRFGTVLLKRWWQCLTLILAVCLGLVQLTACFSNKTPERSYFSIDYTLGTQPRYETPKFESTLVVNNVTSILAYDRQEIVYRNNPYEFQYYWYRLWASKPRKMLRELITGHLRYTQLFSEVSTSISDRLPDYSLDIEIEAIEELDASDTQWFAHLALQLTLQRMTDNVVLWNYSLDAKRPVASNQPVYVVKAMSELLDEEMVKALNDLDWTLSLKLNVEGSMMQPQVSDGKIDTGFSSSVAQENSVGEGENSEDSSTEQKDQPRATLKTRK